MSFDVADAESTVSGDQATIPAGIRHALRIDDGDRLRWILEGDVEPRAEVVFQRTGTFAGVEGYDGEVETDAASTHDEWGLE